MQTTPEQPTHAEKLATLAGQDTGWTYAFNPPPVPTARWTSGDWIVYIGNRWVRKA